MSLIYLKCRDVICKYYASLKYVEIMCLFLG